MLKRFSFLGLIVAFVLMMVPFVMAQDPGTETPAALEYDATSGGAGGAGAESFPPDSDNAGPYGRAWVSGSYHWYCNKDQVGIRVYNEVEVAQWLWVSVWNTWRKAQVRKPGSYIYCDDKDDLTALVVSNGDVGVKFYGEFDAPWDGPDGTGPRPSRPLTPQIPIDKLYLVKLIDKPTVEGGVFGQWVQKPVDFIFLNSQALHGGNQYCIVPLVGFTIKERFDVRTCNTAGKYVGVSYMDFIPLNQKPFINRKTGGFI